MPCGNESLDWTRSVCGRPSFGGVYVFWWHDGAGHFYDFLQNRHLHFLGPGGIHIDWEITHCRLHVAENGFLPLYVGKNASDIANRIGLHLKLKTLRTVPAGRVNGPCKRMTTSCQLRDRLDRLFPDEDDTRGFVRENIALSYVRIDGSEPSFVDRFFFEDIAIGALRPIFNVDSER